MRPDLKQKNTTNAKRSDNKHMDEKNEMQMKEINKPDDESKDNDSQADEDVTKKQPANDYKDSYEMSKLALNRCNQIQRAHSEFLRKGAGHFVSNPKKTIMETYLQSFNIH